MVRRVKRQDDWLYAYCLVEFQSRVDPYMALRSLVYTGLQYEDSIKCKSQRESKMLPPLFPIVIYNDGGRWTATRELGDLFDAMPGSLVAYRPSQRHLVLDEGRVGGAELAAVYNTVAEIIRVESSPELEALHKIIAPLSHRDGTLYRGVWRVLGPSAKCVATEFSEK
jgi:hypothetical protein